MSHFLFSRLRSSVNEILLNKANQTRHNGPSRPLSSTYYHNPDYLVLTMATRPQKNIWVAAGDGDLDRVRVSLVPLVCIPAPIPGPSISSSRNASRIPSITVPNPAVP